MSDPSENLEGLPVPSYVFHRTFKEQLHHAVAASKSTITLSTGQTVLDACGGAGVSCIGQGREEVISSASEQMRTAGYIHTGSYTTTVAEELSAYMLRNNPHGLERAFFVSSGSEAMDAALKLSRQYFFELGETSRVNYISRRMSYHGSTIGAMSVSGNLARKIPYEPLQPTNVTYVRPAYMRHYSSLRDGPSPPKDMSTVTSADEDEFALSLADELDKTIQRLGPKTVIAFIAEPVVGATTGCVTAPRGYFKRIREVCDRYGILLVLDEVMCGAGRTGTYWAFEQEDVIPDIVILGKGLGGGYMPIAALVAHKKVIDVIKNGTSAFVHGHTYMSHPVVCAAALAVQKIIREEKLVERTKIMGELLERRLRETLADCTGVGDIRGRGLFWGVEFFDTANNRPFPPTLQVGLKIQEATFKRGVAVYPGMGTIDGKVGDHVLLAPAYTVTEEEIETALEALRGAYHEIMVEIKDEL